MSDFVDPGIAGEIHDVFAIEVILTTSNDVIEPLRAVKSEDFAEGFEGPGRTLRRVSFELLQADLAARPAKHDRIREVATGLVWSINQVTRRDDVGAWWIDVEEVAA